MSAGLAGWQILGGEARDRGSIPGPRLSNPKSSRPPYGRVDCCVITGDDDVAKHCAMNVLRNLQHVRSVFPPPADAGWVGEAGPGPSY